MAMSMGDTTDHPHHKRALESGQFGPENISKNTGVPEGVSVLSRLDIIAWNLQNWSKSGDS